MTDQTPDAAREADDRLWQEYHSLWWSHWSTPHLAITFGRYWRIHYGLGPFIGSLGYVELF